MWHFLVLLLCCVTQSATAGTLSWVSQDRWVTVKYVIDGDTFVTRKGEKIRLLGINTPETRHETKPAQPFGKQAKAALHKLIMGQQVRLRFDQEKKDKYQRTLAHIYLRSGLWVNAELVRLGLAHVYTFTPNTSAATKLIQLEQQAIHQQLGMWQHQRWQVLNPAQLQPSLLGQFRLLQGKVSKLSKHGWRFSLGKVIISVPRKYRNDFNIRTLPRLDSQVVVRGRLRMSKKGQWFLSVHSTSDIHHIH